MDKIIGMGNALVDVLVKIDDDSFIGKATFAQRKHAVDTRSHLV